MNTCIGYQEYIYWSPVSIITKTPIFGTVYLMNEVEIRTLIQAGVDLRLVAVPRPLDLPGFTVVINTGRLEQLEMKTRRGQVRVFKKLETLWKLCRQLGIAGFEVRAR